MATKMDEEKTLNARIYFPFFAFFLLSASKIPKACTKTTNSNSIPPPLPISNTLSAINLNPSIPYRANNNSLGRAADIPNSGSRIHNSRFVDYFVWDAAEVLQPQGPPFGVIAREVAGAWLRGCDGGVEASGGEGEGVEEVEDLDGGVGRGVGSDLDAVEGRGVCGEGDAVGGVCDAGDAEVQSTKGTLRP
ncbi:hypothetical protein VC83_06556 [Pseudogymnoascus destructans]|uniref:Uncharacterized protein n=1 Tax=Pseudogymnoascus destructans TaxID=655981 RepID=A0A177A857_9PEZI|nr:uncharacterized protein VC83_06556 [Pseudogymnoascus destructans]OAF58329.1 hypothetical protein VC83_06556 [Pseudogymnoascus destructans]